MHHHCCPANYFVTKLKLAVLEGRRKMTFGEDINPVFAPATRCEYIPVSSTPASMVKVAETNIESMFSNLTGQ